jgi:DNA polymerase-4
VLVGLCERVAWRARKRGMKARTVSLKLRYTDFETISRSRSISATHDEVVIQQAIFDLYRAARRRDLGIRLLGVALSKFEVDGRQLQLFDRSGRRAIAIDQLREKYGFDAVHLASSGAAP